MRTMNLKNWSAWMGWLACVVVLAVMVLAPSGGRAAPGLRMDACEECGTELRTTLNGYISDYTTDLQGTLTLAEANALAVAYAQRICEAYRDGYVPCVAINCGP